MSLTDPATCSVSADVCRVTRKLVKLVQNATMPLKNTTTDGASKISSRGEGEEEEEEDALRHHVRCVSNIRLEVIYKGQQQQEGEEGHVVEKIDGVERVRV